MLSGGLSLIRECYESLNPSEQKAARFTLDHPEQMVQMTVSELAAASGSSRSAIIRLCKTLRLKGYQELKLCVAGDLQNTGSHGDEYKEIRPGSSLRTIAASVANNTIFSINETMKLLDLEKLQTAVDLIETAGRIDFYGSGASQLVACDAQIKFMRINKTATAYADNHLQLTSAVTLTPDDVAVAFSNSGETLQTVECVQAAKKAGAKTIGITRYGSNTLAGIVDVPIGIRSTEPDVRSAATSSRIVQLNLVDIIYLAVVGRRYESSLQYLNRSFGAIRRSFRVK
ncbi:MAG: MurR/RpiR family transcriptional regulator [Sporolactobacillus sp.]|jgi:DNA-binding MurR/RpiR family transcriptional regulator|nr:MurR/RpiR family transcriptional regulator [Sporolactobacillus sp.]